MVIGSLELQRKIWKWSEGERLKRQKDCTRKQWKRNEGKGTYRLSFYISISDIKINLFTNFKRNALQSFAVKSWADPTDEGRGTSQTLFLVIDSTNPKYNTGYSYICNRNEIFYFFRPEDFTEDRRDLREIINEQRGLRDDWSQADQWKEGQRSFFCKIIINNN